MYVLAYQDEYGKKHYYSEAGSGEITQFKSIKEAEDKANELLDWEYDDFGSAITKYSVVRLEEQSSVPIKSFRICDDGKECTLSCTEDAVNELNGALAEVKKQYDYKILKDKTYNNGSKVVQFSYEKKTEEKSEYNIVLACSKDTYVIAYKVEDHIEISTICSVLREKYSKYITFFSNKRDNKSGTYTFILTDKYNEFKDDFLNMAKIFFKVKVIEK